MKAIIYLRVSTDQQVESGAGLNAQEDACRKYCEHYKIEVGGIFKDEGLSGSLPLEKRPGLIDAVAALNKEDIFLVMKRDRLGRDFMKVAMIEAAIEKKKAKVISVAGEGTDSNDISAELLRGMIDLFAQHERKVIMHRIKSAMKAKKDRSERIGNIHYGYKLSEDGVHVEPCEHEQEILSIMKKLKGFGYTYRDIAKYLTQSGFLNRKNNPWIYVNIWRILQNN